MCIPLLLLPSIGIHAQRKSTVNKCLFVLEKEHINKPYHFGKWNPESGATALQLNYLGLVHTNSNQQYKILTAVWTWGLSGRTTSRILIYNRYNHYVGNYYMNTASDLPDKLEQGKLIFINNSTDCEYNNLTIDLRKGLPKEIIVKCQGDFGTLSIFSSE
jgi:hypothetical protein